MPVPLGLEKIMLQIGQMQPLEITGLEAGYARVSLDDGRELSIARTELPSDVQQGHTIEVFIYYDNQQQLTATTKRPYAQVGQVALLQVVAVHRIGAFVDLGIAKDVLVPEREQFSAMEVGQSYALYLYLDEEQRLVATPRFEEHLQNHSHYDIGDAVQAIITNRSELGYQVVVDQLYLGMLYHNELFQRVRVGEQLTAYVTKNREDGRLDLRIQRPGDFKLEPLQQQIINKLKSDGGYIALSDKSDPKLIAAVFGVSKGQYKKAIGHLYRQKLIKISANGIMLAE